jgi:hypothetical protein
MSGKLTAAARTALDDLRSEFREGARRHPSLQHARITAPDPEIIREVCQAPIDPAFPKRVASACPSADYGDLHVFLDKDWGQLSEGVEALVPLAGEAVVTLAAHRILRPTEPPPDTPDPAMNLPVLQMRSYGLRQWMLFIHRLAKDRPREPPGAESGPYPGHTELARRATVHTLGYGVFKSSDLILSRLLEWTGPARQALPSYNEKRDRFIFEKYRAGDKLSTIRKAVNNTPGWRKLSTDTGVTRAMERYCKAQKIDVPTRKPRRNRRK